MLFLSIVPGKRHLCPSVVLGAAESYPSAVLVLVLHPVICPGFTQYFSPALLQVMCQVPALVLP
jgi:hypothetical protein